MHRTSEGLTFPPQAWPKFLARGQWTAPEGGGPENGADSDIISTPNLWGVLHLTFLKNRRGKPSDTGFEIIRPRRSQRRVAVVSRADISEINFTRES